MYITEFFLYSVHNLQFSTCKIRKELYMLFFVTQIKYLSYYLAMQSKVKFKKIEDSRKLHTYCTLYGKEHRGKCLHVLQNTVVCNLLLLTAHLRLVFQYFIY